MADDDDDFDSTDDEFEDSANDLLAPKVDKFVEAKSGELRRRLEDKLEQRRLEKMIADYDFNFD